MPARRVKHRAHDTPLGEFSAAPTFHILFRVLRSHRLRLGKFMTNSPIRSNVDSASRALVAPSNHTMAAGCTICNVPNVIVANDLERTYLGTYPSVQGGYG